MAWDFSTDPEWAEQLAWVDAFVREECEPIDLIVKESHDLNDPVRQALIPPLQKIVKGRGLWATHLGPHLGGPGYGQVKLALLNEILGRSECAPIVFGSQAPDSGNSEILAHYGTPELKKRYLEPLLDNRIISCFSMTEPQGGADPKVFTTTAIQDGDHWVINGEKWFSSFASMASFIIVMAMTDPDAPPYERYSMFVVPAETAGIDVLRDVGLGYQLPGGGREGYVRYENVRVPADHMLGPRGGAFVVAQTRLGGGRIHHAMRTVGLVRRIYDMICERAVSRYTQGGADPKVFTTTATQDGDDWIINGEKWYSSFASMASFIIVMAMTDPDAPPYERYSMFVLPGDTPGINVLRDVGLGYQPLGGGREGYVRYENVRVPNDHMLGPRGGAFIVAQTRLGGGRIHHAMRTVGLVRRIYDMICERAVSRYTQGEVLANKQMVQEMIADSWMEIEAFRLLTLQTAWKIDKYNDYKAVRGDISAVKAMMQKVLHDVSARALQIHGSLGTSHEMPFVQYLTESFVLGLADGPTEVHKVTLARLLLKDVERAPDTFPSEHLLRLREAAEAKFADKLAGIPRN